MKKKKYTAPVVEWIPLDNEISLQLESNPPIGPDETNLSPEHLQRNPYNNTLA
jgi:hypothetical protein